MPRVVWILAVLIAAAGFLISAILGVVLPDRGLHSSAVAGSFGLLAALFTAALLRSLESGDVPGIERDWGGLGGEAGGWRMSLPLVYLIGTCLFAILAVSSFVILDLSRGKNLTSDKTTSASPTAPKGNLGASHGGTPAASPGASESPIAE
jgi:hypothetical protein